MSGMSDDPAREKHVKKKLVDPVLVDVSEFRRRPINRSRRLPDPEYPKPKCSQRDSRMLAEEKSGADLDAYKCADE